MIWRVDSIIIDRGLYYFLNLSVCSAEDLRPFFHLNLPISAMIRNSTFFNIHQQFLDDAKVFRL